ncbi:Bacterial sugar transferase [gamma proteobacterium HdN1]|nr:Bacterial sugar transferase [gamma proteobacterium HdN1]
MPHVRLFNHYINGHHLLLGVIEYVLLALAFHLGTYLRFWLGDNEAGIPAASAILLNSQIFALCMIAMGVYPAKHREGLSGMALRTMVSLFLLGFLALSAVFYMVPDSAYSVGRGVLVIATVAAFLLLQPVRIVFFRLFGTKASVRRVLVVGAGYHAAKLLKEFGAHADLGVELYGFARADGAPLAVPESRVIPMPASLKKFVQENGIETVVVASDERRRSDIAGAGFPLEQLLDCKLSGVTVLDSVAFIEREFGKIEPRNISPGWFVFSDGFYHSSVRDFVQRGFDLLASSLLILVAWPLMLFTAIAIKIEEGLKAPILYSQERVGLNGKVFKVHKFRSMRVDAEKFGAVWAQENDPRVTRVGKFIRNVRIDELPQVFNVFTGEMSFVGPRPERPQFVDALKKTIPFFDERHRVKPGITGWAQLCYPYGASEEDSEQKLKYDLYYVKNHSLLLDLVILIQTVEVVLIGKGVR